VSEQSNITCDNRQKKDVIFEKKSGSLGHTEEWSTHWTSQASAKPIRNSDLICLLQGAFNPMIIRLYGDCFSIIMITAIAPENIRTEDSDVKWLELLQSTKLFMLAIFCLFGTGKIP
jgi:hypothetical protein